MPDSYQERIEQKIAEIKAQFGAELCNLLEEVNKIKLDGKGKITAAPVVEQNTMRWTLAWKLPAPSRVRKRSGVVSYELNIVASIEDDGYQARVARVWVQRRASTPIEFDGHTPTTRMHRLSRLSLPDIRAAIEAEWR